MQFKDIVGQEKVKQRLITATQESRIPHAQLFIGPSGTGKLALAIAYAQYIMCENRGESDSCGGCPACKKISKLIHPDLHFVYPSKSKEKSDSGDDDGDKNDDTLTLWREALLSNPYFGENDWYEMIGMENKQGIISTATASDVIRKLNLKSFESDFKVMIIWLPERMNTQAANKLLKLIEEPPAKTVFLLVSENPNSLLKTILSRTQQIMIPPIARESIAVVLNDKYSLSPERAHDISRIANGNFYTALSLMENEGNEYFDHYRQLMRLCYAKDVIGLLDWAEEIASLGRENQKEFLSYALRLSRESLMINIGLDDISYLIGEEADFGKKFSPFIGNTNIYGITDEITQAYEHIMQNGNPSIVFTHFAMRMIKLVPNKPLK